MTKILIFDTDYSFLNKITDWLKAEEYEVSVTDDLKTAKARLTTLNFNIIILGVRYKECEGGKLMNWINTNNYGTPFIVMLDKDDNSLLANAFKKGAHDHIDKRSINRLTLICQIDEVRRNFNYVFNSYVHKSTNYAQCIRQAVKTSGNNDVVLLSGETGSGKSHLARYIHCLSKRNKNLFLPIKCELLDNERFRDQLFGISKGLSSKPIKGILEKVGRGTVFFDEIDKLPLNAQTALVHTIEEGSFCSIGSNSIKRLNAKILFSTSVNLATCLLNGTLRRDLYDLLNNNVIKVPALRMCQEDIIPLCEYFLGSIAQERNTVTKNLSKQAVFHIEAHKWQGNLRELKSILKQADTECTTNLIMCKHLHINKAESPYNGSEMITVKDTLISTGNNKTLAAKLLGISRPTLYAKIKMLGL